MGRENTGSFHGSRIEDYCMIGDCETAALVSREGSIDWLCWPAFSSAACFAALLGTRDHGYWQIAPVGQVKAVRRVTVAAVSASAAHRPSSVAANVIGIQAF